MMRGRLLRRRPGPWILAAVALAALAALATARAGAGGTAVVDVIVAREAIPAGTVLDPGRVARSLARAAVPAGLTLAGLLGSPAEALGRRTAAPLQAGEPLTQAALGGAPGSGPRPLGMGERAVPVPLGAAGGAAAGLAVGMRVDAVAAEGEGRTGRTVVVVAAAEVLAVTGADPVDAVPPEAGSVLLRVSARQALRLTAALNFARDVRLLVRPAGEEEADAP